MSLLEEASSTFERLLFNDLIGRFGSGAPVRQTMKRPFDSVRAGQNIYIFNGPDEAII